MTEDKVTRGRILWCMKHGHDWQPMHDNDCTWKCSVCGAMRKGFE